MPISPTLITLGAATFEGFEVPESVSMGSDQRLVVNEFVGLYKRVVQTLGAQPRVLQWRGAFLYDSAIDRAQYFQTKCQLGQPLEFQWGDFKMLVVIDRFYYDPRNIYHIPYEISLTVVRDDSPYFLAEPPSSDTVLEGINANLAILLDLVAAAQKLAALVTLAQQGQIAAIASQVTSLASTVATVGSGLSSQPITVLQQYQNQATIVVGTATALVVSLSQNSPNNPVSEIAQIGAAAASLVALFDALMESPSAVNVPVMNDSLFRLASNAYGDVEKWAELADYNGLKTARVVAPTTLRLPVLDGVTPDISGVPGTSYETGSVGVPLPERRVRGPR